MGRITNCPDLPEWLRITLVSEEFVLACQSEFDALDIDANGSLSPDELYPVIVALAEEHPITVGTQHCSYLSAIFDEDNNGVISRAEFVELVRFIFVVQWLQNQDRLEAVLRLHDVLSMMEKDVRYVKTNIDGIIASPDVGPWLRDLFMSEDFPMECNKVYDELDSDGNGVLSRSELVPVLVQLTGEHPITITEEHCQQLLEIFDEDGNGTISRTEFAGIAQFVFVMQWLEDQKSVASAEQEALEFQAEIAGGEYRIAQIISMFKSDKAELKKQFGDISKCPDLPEWFRNELSSLEFETMCAEKFAGVDVDANGMLTLEELYPVIEEMTGEHPISVTLDHCQQLMDVVDSNKNGSISKDEFKEFIQFVCLVKWLEGLAQEEAAIAEEVMVAAETMAIDAILDCWRFAQSSLKQHLGSIAQSPDLPDWLRDVFKDPGFIAECERQFDTLDTNKNGTLQPEEVFPVIVELVAGRPVAVSSDHCMKFVEIFDDDKSGGLDRAEFADFVRFVCLMQWLEAEDAAQRQQAEVAEDELRVHQLLDMMEEDSKAIKKNFKRASQCPDMPDWMRDQFAQEEFTALCNEKYDALDADGNGTLSPDELYPMILELSGGHPMSVTTDHCKRLIKMFDEEQKGVFSRREFVDFVKFIWLQLWLEQQRLQQMMELDSLEAEWRITNLLDMWHHNMIGLKGKWGTVCNSPDVPAWLKETLQDSSMTEMCQRQFDDLDADGNGVLTANELLPVVVELCQEHPLDITQEHCQQLLDIFDEDKSGTIERGEFLEFVRFIVVVSWLQEQAGNMAPPQTPSMGSFIGSEALDVEDRADPLQSLGNAPPSSIGQSPESKIFESELKATQEALMATQNQLKAVQMQLQATTGQVAQALSSGPMSPAGNERLKWQQEKEQLQKELAAAQQLAEMQKKGMAETVGKLMTDKMELESQLMMAKAGK
jgi:Ca2+-binding EF-hand superfamily protein